MHHIKATAIGVLLGIHLIYSAAAYSGTGTIILRDSQEAICSFPLPEPGTTQRYSFLFGPAPCRDWSNRARTIELAEIPSATTILLTETGVCSKTENLSFISLKTTKKQTNTSIIAIEYLSTFKKDQIIEPGLQMVDLQIKSPLRDKVNCIEVTTSATPPPP
ncbi:hypothetical protein [Pseudomonas sp. RGM2987]|uniref:hypothetical protein n=1 Tax=Pseudomonas sp. RGM2987 TaxID=2930090 RepID=UPI001FD65DAD|nr:hypothetical protein [Pseudomonas sp. RGM2987]MCJ8205291.1 hypothetical protein [Pseudomonas sp. RGM2987]